MKKRNMLLLIAVMGCISVAGCGKQGESNTTVVEESTGNEKAYGMEATAPKTSNAADSEKVSEKYEETDSGAASEKKDGTDSGTVSEKNTGSGAGKGDGTVAIGEDTAKQIALETAGVSEDEITNLYIVREWDDGYDVYDVEFYAANQEYDYDIDVYTGEIRSFDYDMESERNVGNAGTQAADGNSGVTGAQAANENVKISEDEAIALVLEKVPGASSEHVKIELERDDGHWKYEGEIHYNKKEYEFELNAENGQLLEWSEEADD